MGRSGYLNLEVSMANVSTVIAVEMKHNTDQTVTQLYKPSVVGGVIDVLAASRNTHRLLIFIHRNKLFL